MERVGWKQSDSDNGYDVSVTYGGPATSVQVTVDDDEPAEYDRFEDLAQKLVQVPKTELDEKRRES